MDAFKYGIDIPINSINSPSSIDKPSTLHRTVSLTSVEIKSESSPIENKRRRSFSDSRWKTRPKYKNKYGSPKNIFPSRNNIYNDFDNYISDNKINLSEKNKLLIQKFIDNKINYIYSKEYIYLNDMNYKTPEVNTMIKWFDKRMNYWKFTQ